MLDETDARVILLLAPAGYGKTTLARQWAKTLNGAIWVSLTPAHRDVASLGERIAEEIGQYDSAAGRFLAEFIRSRSNPRKAAEEVGRAISDKLAPTAVRWIVLDDFHEIAEADEPQEVVTLLLERNPRVRFLFCSRVRPRWATTRRVFYNEIFEMRRDDLAMTKDEAGAVVGRRPDIQRLAAGADGWPAVVGLAANLPAANRPPLALPDAIHDYVADELFTSASSEAQAWLLSFALAPNFTRPTLERIFGRSWRAAVETGTELGFLRDDDPPELHPLLREFLLAKVRDEAGFRDRANAAISSALKEHEWEIALDLVTRFELRERFDSVLTAAYEPLRRSGRIATLARFGQTVQRVPGYPPAVLDLIDAEVALCDGRFDLAAELAEQALHRLGPGHSLRSRAATILGHSNFFLINFERSEEAFQDASEAAADDQNLSEALHGLAVTKIFGELPGANEAVASLAARRHNSPTDLARFLVDDLSLRHFEESVDGPLHLDRAMLAMSSIEDPRARAALAYRASYVLAQRAEYTEAETWLRRFFVDAHEFVLEFAVPYAWWVQGMIHLGARRFGLADQALQRIEDNAYATHNENHRYNAQALRARLLIQTGKVDEARRLVHTDPRHKLIPSWHAEYLATRAMALACSGDALGAAKWASAARCRSRALEVAMLAAGAEAIASAWQGKDASSFLELAHRTGVWDPVICALRASPQLASQLSKDESWRETLEALYSRSNDQILAKRAGFRIRAARKPGDLLSPRELEVLGLIARGYTNREISHALVIADATTKVHVRHVLEKLGVKTRAEAVARYEMFATGRASNEASTADGSSMNS